MRLSRVLAPILVVALIASAFVTSGTAAAQKKKGKKSGPKVVGTDPADDWGCNQDCQLQPIGDAMGQELVKAEIEPAKKDLNFIITVNSLPPNGGMPEFTRYVWQMLVDGEFVELDGKWSNYSRGVCDPTSGACPPPRDPGMQPFFVRGNCEVLGNVLACEELGVVHAEFDSGAATITIPVPLEMLGAKKGSKIVGAAQSDTGFSGITAIPSAFYSQTSMPFDMLALTGVFTVPRK